MEGHIVMLNYKPEYQDVFVESIQELARVSLENEPGMLHYEVMQDRADPSILYVYMIFTDQAAFEAHAKAPHNVEWREKIKPWHAAELSDFIKMHRPCALIYPPESER